MESQGRLRRGRFLAAGLGAIVAGFFGSARPAHADDGEPLVLGTQNTAKGTTQLAFGGSGGALEVDFGSSARAILGDGTHGGGTAVFGELVPAVQTTAGPIWDTPAAGWFTGGASPGAVGVSDSHIGVIGLSGPVGSTVNPSELDPAGAHFVGAGGAAGLCTRSVSVPGVGSKPGALAMSDSNVGLVGATGAQDEDELYDLQAAGLWGVGGAAAGVIGSGQVGLWGLAGAAGRNPGPTQLPAFPVGNWGQGGDDGVGALAQGHIGTWGAAPGADVSLNPQPLPPTGVWGQGGAEEIGVLGQGQIGVWGAAAQAAGTPTLPAVQKPAGVWGQASEANAVGVIALNGDGRALEVAGRAGFSGVGGGALDRRGDAFVSDPGIAATSHVIVTLQGDPGKGAPWVEIQPGKGFMVHMTQATNKSVPFSYLVLDAG
jgi:hypothetical protein